MTEHDDDLNEIISRGAGLPWDVKERQPRNGEWRKSPNS
jgi:hypothetical protein